MLTVRKQAMTIYVEKSSQQWCVRDANGNFWIVPNVENGWDQRQPFRPTAKSELEPVPGHYKDMLGLPF